MQYWLERLFGALKGKRFLYIISPLVAMVVLAAFLVSGVSAGPMPTTYYACVNMKTGAIYMVNAGDTCQKGYTPISWNQVGPQGSQGPQGPAGPTGPQGPAGPTQTLSSQEVVSSMVDVTGFVEGYAQAICPAGTVVSGGGFLVSAVISGDWLPRYSRISSTNGWEIDIINTGSATIGIQAYAICLTLS